LAAIDFKAEGQPSMNTSGWPWPNRKCGSYGNAASEIKELSNLE
jgi:hypothetical protein